MEEPGTAATEYSFEAPEQMEEGPVMVPGVAGTETGVTTSVCAGELPQVLLAVTEMLPLAEPAVILMASPVELPDQPLGKVHV